MSGSVTVSVRSYVKPLTAAANAKAVAATAKAAQDIEAGAKALARVDTGNMRNSINSRGSGLTWLVHSPAEYSIFNEYGTYKMGAQPFMTPATEAVKPSYLAAMGRLV